MRAALGLLRHQGLKTKSHGNERQYNKIRQRKSIPETLTTNRDNHNKNTTARKLLFANEFIQINAVLSIFIYYSQRSRGIDFTALVCALLQYYTQVKLKPRMMSINGSKTSQDVQRNMDRSTQMLEFDLKAFFTVP